MYIWRYLHICITMYACACMCVYICTYKMRERAHANGKTDTEIWLIGVKLFVVLL